MHIELPDTYVAFIDACVGDGAFADRTPVVKAALKLLLEDNRRRFQESLDAAYAEVQAGKFVTPEELDRELQEIVDEAERLHG